MEPIKTKLTKLNKPATASLWYFFATVLSRGIGMLGTPIFTRLLSAQDFGLYALFLSVCTVVGVPLSLELSGAVCYTALQKFSNKKESLMASASTITFLLGSGYIISFLALTPLISAITGIDGYLIPLIPFFSLCTAIISLYTTWLKYEYKYKEVTFINILLALLSPMLSVLFISALGRDNDGRILGTLIINLLVALPLYISMQRVRRGLFDKKMASYLLKGALPILPHYLSVSLIIRFGEIMLGSLFSPVEVGKFTVASSVGLSLSMISTSLLSALGPWLTRRVKSGDVLKIRRIIDLSLKLLSLSLLFVCAIAPEVLRILAPKEYADALFAVYLLALSVIPMFLSGVITTLRTSFPHIGRGSIPSVLALLTSILLSLTLLAFDYRLLSLVVLLAYSVLAVAGLYLLKKDTRILPLSKGSVVTLLFTAVYSIILALFNGQIIIRGFLLLPLIPVGIVYLRTTLAEMREKE